MQLPSQGSPGSSWCLNKLTSQVDQKRPYSSVGVEGASVTFWRTEGRVVQLLLAESPSSYDLAPALLHFFTSDPTPSPAPLPLPTRSFR